MLKGRGLRKALWWISDARFRGSRLTKVRRRNKLYIRGNIPYRDVEGDGIFRNTVDDHVGATAKERKEKV